MRDTSKYYRLGCTVNNRAQLSRWNHRSPVLTLPSLHHILARFHLSWEVPFGEISPHRGMDCRHKSGVSE